MTRDGCRSLALSAVCVTMSAEDHAQTAGPRPMSEGGDHMPTLRINEASTKPDLERAMTGLRAGTLAVTDDRGEDVTLDQLLEAWATA